MSQSKFLATIGLLSAMSVHAQSKNVVSPQVTERLQTPLKQTKVTDCGAATREVQWGTTRINYSVDGLLLQGLQSTGATWQAIVPASNVLKCEVWSASLHKGDKPSLLIFKAPESGFVEGGELTILSFDSHNRPDPWKVDGAFTSTAQGISQVAADSSSGDAQVLVPVLEGDPHAKTVEVTSLYQRRNDTFAKFVGTDSKGVTWPFISGNTTALTGKEQLTTSTLEIAPRENSSANALRSNGTTIVQRAAFSDEQPVVLSNGQRSKFPAMLVLDKADGSRLIYTDENVVEGVDEAIKAHATVDLQGTSCESEECRPFLLSAKAQNL